MNNLPIEIERKYIIRMPDFEALKEQRDYTVSSIVQIYIESAKGVTHRIRSRAFDGKTVYTETKKIRIDNISAIEDEREITETEFLVLAQSKKSDTDAIIKTRHTFKYESTVFEIDVYPKWKDSCIMETELRTKEEQVVFPKFIEILKEVTGDKKYSNASMAKKFPEETA